MTVSRTVDIVRRLPLFEALWSTAVAAMDRLQGMRTVGNVALADLGVATQDRVHYTPSGWQTLQRVSSVIAFSPRDTFVDFGSGKGRVILMAARDFPFKRVIGVEISADLNTVARQNLDANRGKLKCTDVALVTADALAFEIPDDMTVAYFYSPFTGDVFRKVIDRIEASLPRRSTDRLFVVLLRPVGKTIRAACTQPTTRCWNRNPGSKPSSASRSSRCSAGPRRFRSIARADASVLPRRYPELAAAGSKPAASQSGCVAGSVSAAMKAAAVARSLECAMIAAV